MKRYRASSEGLTKEELAANEKVDEYFQEFYHKCKSLGDEIGKNNAYILMMRIMLVQSLICMQQMGYGAEEIMTEIEECIKVILTAEEETMQ